MAKQKNAAKNVQTQEPETVEKLTRREAVCRAISEVDGDTSYDEIIDRAQELLKASGDANADDRDATWNLVERIMENLADIGLVELEWDVRVHPTVARLGKVNGK